jgi:hypothetical protein
MTDAEGLHKLLRKVWLVAYKNGYNEAKANNPFLMPDHEVNRILDSIMEKFNNGHQG